MWHNNTLITRNQISIVLLFLLSLRVIPFGLLHFHNNNFTNFDALGVIAELPSEEVTLEIENPACSFHQFLTLVNNGFVVEMECEMLGPVVIGTDLIVLPESRVKYLLFKILNKGSPLLA